MQQKQSKKNYSNLDRLAKDFLSYAKGSTKGITFEILVDVLKERNFCFPITDNFSLTENGFTFEEKDEDKYIFTGKAGDFVKNLMAFYSAPQRYGLSEAEENKITAFLNKIKEFNPQGFDKPKNSDQFLDCSLQAIIRNREDAAEEGKRVEERWEREKQGLPPTARPRLMGFEEKSFLDDDRDNDEDNFSNSPSYFGR